MLAGMTARPWCPCPWSSDDRALLQRCHANRMPSTRTTTPATSAAPARPRRARHIPPSHEEDPAQCHDGRSVAEGDHHAEGNRLSRGALTADEVGGEQSLPCPGVKAWSAPSRVQAPTRINRVHGRAVSERTDHELAWRQRVRRCCGDERTTSTGQFGHVLVDRGAGRPEAAWRWSQSCCPRRTALPRRPARKQAQPCYPS